MLLAYRVIVDPSISKKAQLLFYQLKLVCIVAPCDILASTQEIKV